jgi:hypothetical protein
MKRSTRFTTVMGMIVALAGLPTGGETEAQMTDGTDSRIEVDARGGISLPVSDLGDVADPGASFGLGATYWVSERIGVRVNGDAGLLTGLDADETGSGFESPDLDLYRYTGGVAARLTPRETRWDVTANLGAGGATYSSDDFAAGTLVNPVTGEAVQDFSGTYFSTTGGLKIGYDVTERVAVFAGGQAYLDFADEEDTAIFSEVAPQEVEPGGFDTAWTIPLQAGVKIRF